MWHIHLPLFSRCNSKTIDIIILLLKQFCSVLFDSIRFILYTCIIIFKTKNQMKNQVVGIATIRNETAFVFCVNNRTIPKLFIAVCCCCFYHTQLFIRPYAYDMVQLFGWCFWLHTDMHTHNIIRYACPKMHKAHNYNCINWCIACGRCLLRVYSTFYHLNVVNVRCIIEWHKKMIFVRSFVRENNVRLDHISIRILLSLRQRC